MGTFVRCAIFILLLLSMPGTVFSAVLFSPDLEWKSIRTDRFWIHYHQGLDVEARRLANLAENAHRWLSPLQRWNPYFRTDVILVDNQDSANGFATPYPFNRVQIFVARPELDSVLGNFGDWLDLVFVHEYTHTLNLDQINGLPSATRYVFGRTCFPNIFLPVWMVEGNAVHSESRLAPYGRNNSSYTEMVMRSEYAENRFKSITEASHYPRRWPTGSVPYLYGGLFVDFLEKKYGAGRFPAVFEENSDNIVPFLVNKNARDIYGDSFIDLWKEWESYLRVYYARQIDRIKTEKLTEFRMISSSGHSTGLPRFGRDGNELFYVRITNRDEPALMKHHTGTGRTEKLCAVNAPNSMSVSRNGTVVLSDLEYFESFSLYNEAIEYGGRCRRMSRGLRGSYIDFSSSRENAVLVRSESDRYSLVIADSLLSSQRTVIEKSDIQMAFTKYSPDGTRIVFTMKDRSGNADLVMYTGETGVFLRLTFDRSNDITPAWHPDGRRVLFSSDRKGGVYNLYEIDLESLSVSRLTNLIGGAFAPDVSPDGKSIAFASYGAAGFDIAIMEYPSKPIESEKLATTAIAPEYFRAAAIEVPREPAAAGYSPARSIFPPFWAPLLGSEEINRDRFDQFYGVMIPGMDTLYQHFYSLSLYAYAVQKRAVLEIDYILARFYPNILLNYRNEALFFGEDDFPWADDLTYGLKRTLTREGTIGVDVPVIYFRSSHDFLLSYKYEETITDIYIPPSAINEHYNTLLTRARLLYAYTGSREYSYSVSKEDGRDFYVFSDIYNSALGSDISYYKFQAELAEYLPGFAKNNVVMLRGRGGASFDNPGYLAPFNLGRFEKGRKGAPDLEDEELGLRGYPSGAVYGSRLAIAAAEYRLPIVQRDAGIGTLPVLFRDLWCVVFGEYGNVWNGTAGISDFRSSAGLELHARFTIGYYLDLRGFIGYARGFNRLGESQVYFGVGTYIEGAFKNFYKSLGYL